MTKLNKIPFEDYLKIEQVKALFGSLPFILGATFGVSLLSVSILWKVFSHTYLSIWLGVALLLVIARWWTAKDYHADSINEKNHKKWLNLFCIFAFLTGTHFGLISIFFLSAEHHIHVLFVTCLYAGYIAAASSRTGFYIPAFVSFGLPATILFSIGYIKQSDSVYTSIGLMILFYFIVMLMFARNTKNLFAEGRDLYYKNNQLLAEIIVQKETAEQAVDAKNQFLAAASHDLRQPLHALGLFIDALRPHIDKPETNLILEKITQSKQAINGLLHSLLDISRLDAKVVENNPKDCSLATVIKPIEEEYKLAAKEKGIQLEININKKHIVYVDPLLIERVLRNIIDNSVKYTSTGEVSVNSEDQSEHIKIIVEDTGIGIPKENQSNIFIEFKQLNNPERDRKKGLGLGLSIVKRLCDLMQIELKLKSLENKGTTITLLVPKGTGSKIIHSITPNEIVFQGLKIIVIDDERDILDGMQAILNNWGCKVLIALNGDEAITVLHQSDDTPDLIIADFRLRDNESGIDVIENIREEYNENINALLVTGDTAPDRLQLSQMADVVVLHKPIATEELAKQIQFLLSK